MDGDKAICVRLEQGDQKSVQIVSLQTGAVTSRFPMAAESAILSPDGKTIAVRAGTALQVYNLELQKKVKSHKLPDGEVSSRAALCGVRAVRRGRGKARR
jgi:ABC-type uncharacterized transport system permease subunit